MHRLASLFFFLSPPSFFLSFRSFFVLFFTIVALLLLKSLLACLFVHHYLDTVSVAHFADFFLLFPYSWGESHHRRAKKRFVYHWDSSLSGPGTCNLLWSFSFDHFPVLLSCRNHHSLCSPDVTQPWYMSCIFSLSIFRCTSSAFVGHVFIRPNILAPRNTTCSTLMWS